MLAQCSHFEAFVTLLNKGSENTSSWPWIISDHPHTRHLMACHTTINYTLPLCLYKATSSSIIQTPYQRRWFLKPHLKFLTTTMTSLRYAFKSIFVTYSEYTQMCFVKTVNIKHFFIQVWYWGNWILTNNCCSLWRRWSLPRLHLQSYGLGRWQRTDSQRSFRENVSQHRQSKKTNETGFWTHYSVLEWNSSSLK